MFNTLMYAKKLEEAGVARPQAEATVQIMAEIVEGSLATKQDILDLEKSLANIEKSLRTDIRNDLQQFEYRVVLKLGAIVTAAITIAFSILTFVLQKS